MEEGLRWWAHCSRWWNTAQVSKHNHFIQNTEMLLQKPVTGHLMWCPVWAAASLKHVKQWREYLTSDKIIWCCLGDSGSSEPSSSVCPGFCPEKWFRNHLFWQDHCWLDSRVVYSVKSVSVSPLVWMWLEDERNPLCLLRLSDYLQVCMVSDFWTRLYITKNHIFKTRRENLSLG